MKLQTGIWVDFNEIFLIDIQGNMEPRVRHIYFPMPCMVQTSFSDFNSDPQLLDKHAHQLNEKACEAVWMADELFIFGPSQAVSKMVNFAKQKSEFSPRILAVEPTPDIPLTTKIAKVESFFKQFNYD